MKAVVARLVQGETVAALAREYGTIHQSIMRIRQARAQNNWECNDTSKGGGIHGGTF